MRANRPSRRLALALAAGVVLCVGCPSRFDPRAQPVVSSPNQAAGQAFQDARSRFEAGQYDAARLLFVKFARDFPDDPLKPYAQIFAGRAAYEKGDYAAARTALEAPASGPPDQASTEQARFYLGLSQARLGQCTRARDLLSGIEERLAPGDDAVEMHAALALCAERGGDLALALAQWGAYHEIARDPERAFARLKAQLVADRVPAGRALELYRAAPSGSLARAVLGAKAALEARRAGAGEKAEDILRESEKLREKLGFGGRREEVAAPAARQDAHLIGCILPLSGPYRAQGRRALRGAAMAAEILSGGPFALAVRDTGGDRGRTERAVEELASEEGVVAIVGPLDRGDAEAAAHKAAALGVPLIDLAVASGAGGAAGRYVFHAVHDPVARVRALVGRVRAQRANAAAILYPDSPYGRKMRDLFVAEAQRAGMAVAGQSSYDPAATAFTSQVRELRVRRFDALFVPDTASKLELIAPALAAADLWPAPPGAARQRNVRNIFLLSTAEDLSAKILRESRYLQGALLAPGYFPEEDSFVQQYRAENGEDPKLFEAFALDAVHAVRAAVEAGARGRAEVANYLSALQGVHGVTGTIQFAASGERADPAAVYTVIGEAIHRAQ